MIIGLTGKARVGKDTAGKFIESYGYTRLAFADPIKAGLQAMIPGWDSYAKEEPIVELAGLSPRVLMQTLGTEWGRSLDSEFWIRVASMRLPADRNVVITDVRFNNEALWVKRQGGRIIKIERDVEAVASHASEQGVDDDLVDYHLNNNATLHRLEYSIHRIIRGIPK